MLRLAKFCPLSIDLMVSQFDILVVVMEDVRLATQTGVSQILVFYLQNIVHVR